VTYYAENPLTPLHSGRHYFVDTGILGISQRQKNRVRKRTAIDNNQEHINISSRVAKKVRDENRVQLHSSDIFYSS
jgi:hypothetical protein